MQISSIRDAIHAVPFRPFRLRLADGRELAVSHPDFTTVSPNGREVTVYSPESRMSILEPLLIVSIERTLVEESSGPADSSGNGEGQDAPA